MNKIKKKLLYLGGILITIIACLILIYIICDNEYDRRNNNSHNIEVDSIFEYDERFWMCLFSTEGTFGTENSDGESKVGLQENMIDYTNYWDRATRVINLCYNNYKNENRMNEQDLEECKEIMENIMATYERYGYFPRPEYKYANLEYGWVSAMDAPSIMVAAQCMYEVTMDEKYNRFILDLCKYVVKPTRENGFNFENGKEVWPLEYASINSKDDINEYVLNGSLLGYVCVKAMNGIIKDDAIAEYLEAVESTYEKKIEIYRYKNGLWSYYMKGDNVNPMHYVIFEMKLLDAAFYLSDLSFFKEEREYRSNIVKETMQPFFEETGEGMHYVMLRAGRPNYYLVDCYGTTIAFFNSKNELIKEDSNTLSGGLLEQKDFYAAMFLEGTVRGAENYKVYSVMADRRYLLFEGKVVSETKESKEEKINVEYDASYDAVYEENTYNIDAIRDKKLEGDISVICSEEQELDKIYALEIDNLQMQTITPVGIQIWDTSGNGVSRYYTRIDQGKNLIVFDGSGFVGIDALKNIKQIDVRIYTENLDKELFFEVGNLYVFNDSMDYYNYINSSDYHICNGE